VKPVKVEMFSFVSAGGNDELVYTDSLHRDTLLCKIFEMDVNGSTFCLLVFLAIKRLHKVSMVMKVYVVVFAEQVSHESALVQIRFLLVCVSTVTEDNFTVFCGSRQLDMQIFNSQKSIYATPKDLK